MSVPGKARKFSPGRYPRASFSGDPKYLECVKEVVLGKNYGEEFKDSFIDAVATPGGSGAVSNTIWNYVDKGEKILIPDWMWESYKIMSEEFGVKYELYSLFDENGAFNTADFEQKAEKIIEDQKQEGEKDNDSSL